MQPIGRPSPTAFLAIGAAAAANVLGLVGLAALALGVAMRSMQDATLFGGFVAVALGAAAVIAEILAIVVAVVELVAAGNGATRRSRVPAFVALALALVAPVTWAIEWLVLAGWLLDGAGLRF